MSRVKTHYHEDIVSPRRNEPLTTQELRLALVDVVDNRAKLSRYDLVELESIVSTTAYFLKKELDARDYRFIDECLEGTPV